MQQKNRKLLPYQVAAEPVSDRIDDVSSAAEFGFLQVFQIAVAILS